MKTKFHAFAIGLSVSMFVLAAAPVSLAQTYSLTDLGTLGGATSIGISINNNGKVVGYSDTASGLTHAFTWSNGAMTDLGTLGGNWSAGYGINDAGTVVGQSKISGNSVYDAFSYSNGLITDLPALGGNDSAASAINSGGTVVGFSSASDGHVYAFSYSNGTLTNLGSLGGPGTNSLAYWINDSGAIVGFSYTAGDSSPAHAVIFSNGSVQDLGTLGGRNSVAHFISNAGTIVGSSDTNFGDFHAFSYSHGAMFDLGTLAGRSSSYASSVNDAGIIVGWSGLSGYSSRTAFIYSNGVMTDLNSLVSLPGVTLTEADGINNLGQIVAYGSDGRGYLLTPVSTPNGAPTAVPGPDQSIRAGATVLLNGIASYDDNTPSANLTYAWSFAHLPGGSTAVLIEANTPTPSFVADLADTYIVKLVVTDASGLASTPAYVTISSVNLPPSAVAKANPPLVVIGNTVTLNGTGSTDPEHDPLTYSWVINSAPAGSTATLVGANTATALFVPLVAGVYQINLTVSDPLGPGTPAVATITATTAVGYAQIVLVQTNAVVVGLTPGRVTTLGNQEAFSDFLGQAVAALDKGNTAKAITKIQDAINRTDGCALRGKPDGNGPGRDWIIDPAAQAQIYPALVSALNALTH